jgi:hypothetical protein
LERERERGGEGMKHIKKERRENVSCKECGKVTMNEGEALWTMKEA